MRKCSASKSCCRRRISRAIRDALDGDRRGACAAAIGAFRSSKKIAKRPLRICSPRASAPPADVCMPAVRETIRCSQPCACTCATPRRRCAAARTAVADALESLAARHARSGAARLYPHAAGHAEQRRALGVGLCRGISRRCGRTASRRSGASAKTRWDPLPASARRILHISREATRAASRFRRHPRAGDGGAVVARQSGGAAAVRNHAAHAGPGHGSRPICCCSTRRNSAS